MLLFRGGSLTGKCANTAETSMIPSLQITMEKEVFLDV